MNLQTIQNIKISPNNTIDINQSYTIPVNPDYVRVTALLECYKSPRYMQFAHEFTTKIDGSELIEDIAWLLNHNKKYYNADKIIFLGLMKK